MLPGPDPLIACLVGSVRTSAGLYLGEGVEQRGHAGAAHEFTLADKPGDAAQRRLFDAFGLPTLLCGRADVGGAVGVEDVVNMPLVGWTFTNGRIGPGRRPVSSST